MGISAKILTDAAEGVKGNAIGGLGKAWRKIGGLGTAIGAISSISDYADAKNNGASNLSALGTAGANQLMWSVMGAKMGIGLGIAQGVAALVPAAVQMEDQYSSSLAHKTRAFGKGYTDFNAAQTMRQRSIQAIQESRLNTRSAMGNEAQYLHR